MAKYMIGYEIVGYMLIDAADPRSAAAEATRKVKGCAGLLEPSGENEYRCPFGEVKAVTRNTKKLIPRRQSSGQDLRAPSSSG